MQLPLHVAQCCEDSLKSPLLLPRQQKSKVNYHNLVLNITRLQRAIPYKGWMWTLCHVSCQSIILNHTLWAFHYNAWESNFKLDDEKSSAPCCVIWGTALTASLQQWLSNPEPDLRKWDGCIKVRLYWLCLADSWIVKGLKASPYCRCATTAT